jgi:hypothetical protein
MQRHRQHGTQSIEQRQTEQKQANAITKSCYFQIRNIGRNRSYTTEDAYKTLVCLLIASRLDYGNALLYIVNTQHNLEATACSKYSS